MASDEARVAHVPGRGCIEHGGKGMGEWKFRARGAWGRRERGEGGSAGKGYMEWWGKLLQL